MTNLPEKYLSSLFPTAQEKWTVGDMFCGGGGTTTGIVRVPGVEVLWAINHDEKAIASHAANHPETKHYREDITLLDVEQLEPVDIIWMSAACTFFSNANGGQECDPQSRMLSEQIYRYAAHCKPKYIVVENVVEFRKWGPLKLNKKGKWRPDTDKSKEGSYYHQWISTLKSMGYVNYSWRKLNAADFGAYTSRERYFGVFSLEDYPIRFPSPTHHKKGVAGLEKWKAVKDLLDFEDKGQSILNRHGQKVESTDYRGRKSMRKIKPLEEKTLRRIYAGLQKFVAGQQDSAFISKYLGNNEHTGINNGCSIEEPALTITTQNRLALVQATKKLAFITQRYTGENRNVSIDRPCPVITSADHNELVQVSYVDRCNPCLALKGKEKGFLLGYYGGDKHSSLLENPCPTLCTKDTFAIVQLRKASSFLVKHYGGKPEGKCIGTSNPAGTITTSDHHSLVQVNFAACCNACPALRKQQKQGFMMGYYSNGNNLSGFHAPCNTVTTKDRYSAVFVMKDYGRGHNCNSVESPAGTVTTTPKLNLVQAVKPFILSYHFGNTGASVETASPTICASRDTYLVSANTGNPLIADHQSDSPAMRKIKEFMREHDIADVTMRMLKVPELLEIQGFPKNYVLIGNQTEKKKFIGNSVVPVVAEKIIGSLVKAANEKCVEVKQLTLGF